MNASENYPELKGSEDIKGFIEAGGVIVGVDVDTQKDFAQEGGGLYVETSPEVRANIARLSAGIQIKIGSVDSHAFDAWEFQANGGPFPAHCVKGTDGWLKIDETQTAKARFIPMSEGSLVVGEDTPGAGNRQYGPQQFADEVVDQGVTGIFEKEVYSMFANPNAEALVEAVVQKLEQERGLTRDQILFAAYGHCTGGYCVDGAAEGLRERGYRTAIIEDATAPLNISQQGEEQDGAEVTRQTAREKNIHLLTTEDLITQ